MILRAQTTSGKLIYFGLEDAPVCINDKQSILCNRPNSPIILSQTIARGLDDKSMFEYDFVMSVTGSFVGFVVYRDGFYVWNGKTNILTTIRNTDNYKFVQNTPHYKTHEASKLASAIRFSNGSRLFRLNRIMYSDKENIYVELKGCTGPVNLTTMRLCTGVGNNRNELAFGDFLEDGEVVLHNYHPMVKLADGTFRELESKDYE